MENASKALLITAGILIGVMILSLIVVVRITFLNFSDEYYNKLKTQKIQEFNTNFTKYENRTDLTAQDIATMYNYAQEWNKQAIEDEKISFSNVRVNGVNYIQYDSDFLNNASYNIDTSTGREKVNIYKYKIEIKEYSDSGRVKKINVTFINN